MFTKLKNNHIKSSFLQINGTKFNKRVAITEEQVIKIFLLKIKHFFCLN